MKGIYLLVITLFALSSCSQTSKENSMPDIEKKNETIETIMARRSIRSYKPEQITKEQLDTIIQCGINAPSALNKQSWEIRVIQNPALLKKINDTFVENAKGKQLQGSASRAQEEGFSVFHNAPTLIIVARDKNNPYSSVDCGIFAQNILLSAKSIGIGTCVIGSVAPVFGEENGKELMQAINIPDTHEVIFGIAVGYANESPDAKPRDTDKVQYIK